MNQILEIVIAFFLVAGAAFAFIGSLGLSKFDDFYMRLHGPTKATTLGLGGMLTASAIYFTFTTPLLSLHEVLISMFLFITAPVSAHILAKTAMHKHFPYLGGQEDPLRHPMNIQIANVSLPVDDSDELVAVSGDVEVRIERAEVEEFPKNAEFEVVDSEPETTEEPENTAKEDSEDSKP